MLQEFIALSKKKKKEFLALSKNPAWNNKDKMPVEICA